MQNVYVPTQIKIKCIDLYFGVSNKQKTFFVFKFIYLLVWQKLRAQSKEVTSN